MKRATSKTLLGLLAVAVTTGCYAETGPQPIGYAQVTSAPLDIETYPSVAYQGQPVYFYGDHWWYRNGASWSYYQSEPAELHQQRDVLLAKARPQAHAAPRATDPEALHDDKHEGR